jgi:hypothetical protein
MTSQFDHAALLGTYLRHVQRIERSDLLSADHRAPFSDSEIRELRRLAGSRQAPTGPLVERVGAEAPGTRPAHPHGWFQQSLVGLPE